MDVIKRCPVEAHPFINCFEAGVRSLVLADTCCDLTVGLSQVREGLVSAAQPEMPPMFGIEQGPDLEEEDAVGAENAPDFAQQADGVANVLED